MIVKILEKMECSEGWPRTWRHQPTQRLQLLLRHAGLD